MRLDQREPKDSVKNQLQSNSKAEALSRQPTTPGPEVPNDCKDLETLPFVAIPEEISQTTFINCKAHKEPLEEFKED
ncbi:unnamed protein product [Caretta caretta]